MHTTQQEEREVYQKKEDFSLYLGEEAAMAELDKLSDSIASRGKNFIGYPCNAALKLERFFGWWSSSPLSKSPLNEVGNPSEASSYSLNARRYEREVLAFFASLYSIQPHWGYVTSGGTQGNEQGLYMGREVLKKWGNPVLYVSQEAHYSIRSLAKVLSLDIRIIASTATGEMDYEDLKQKLERERPALFSLSIGTTFKGAIDKIEIVDAIVRSAGIAHVFYHADAALFGGYLPFCEILGKPKLDFKQERYDSIAVSGHKFFGSPTPLGIFLIKAEHTQAIEGDYIEYIHSHNLTIPCSRSALSTLIFWWILSTTENQTFREETKTMLANAHYLYQELLKRGIAAWLNPYSNTVFFEAPDSALSMRWTLSLYTCEKLGPLAHVIVMQHVDKAMLDAFLTDIDALPIMHETNYHRL